MSIKIVRRHGSPYWYLRGAVRGITVDETTGTDDRDVAEEIIIRREAQLLDSSIHGRRAVATFLEAAVAYLEAGGSPRFVERITSHFGTTSLAKIDQAAVERAARILYPDARPQTVNRQVFTPVSAILHHAAKRGLCDRPMIERPSQPKGRVRWLTTEEASRLVDAASDHLKPLLKFLFFTGCRVSEALTLDWREVDLQHAHVVFLDTKNGEDRGVPLHPDLVAELANLENREGAVFCRPDGEPYSPKINAGGQIKTAFAGACRRAGITNFHPHDCRHTWATWHYRQSRDLGALMRLGGWKSERMVLRYAHVNVGELAASIEALKWGKSGDQSQSPIKEKGNQ